MSLVVTLNKNNLTKLVNKLLQAAKPIDQATARLLGQTVVDTMKEIISSGTSPIAGKGSFPAYKKPDRYPGKRKAHTPVNLELSGDFLNSLTFKVQSGPAGYSARVGYFDSKEAKKEKGHRQGVNSQPKRPTIPKGNEKFHPEIIALIREILQKRINDILK